VGQFGGGGLAGGDQVEQVLAFLGGERYLVLLHGGILPVPPKDTEEYALDKSALTPY
jgi:hypothetical protein